MAGALLACTAAVSILLLPVSPALARTPEVVESRPPVVTRAEGCGYAGVDLNLAELGRIARERDVEETVRAACRRTPPPPSPPPPAAPVKPPPTAVQPAVPPPSPPPPPTPPKSPEPFEPVPAKPPPRVTPSPTPIIPRAYRGAPGKKGPEGQPLTSKTLLLVAPAVLAAAALGAGRGRR
ncbi:hypothetical protein [Streptomyces sp. N35]|uniref:hypothetical protein n=1 Tax=Streptomyces sp. N35 TaxID=2795730 RepID=UPI0018F7238F|nr:hypothetical protein [Streptomyces sp. N35]